MAPTSREDPTAAPAGPIPDRYPRRGLLGLGNVGVGDDGFVGVGDDGFVGVGDDGFVGVGVGVGKRVLYRHRNPPTAPDEPADHGVGHL